jgi:hypothetical protein
VVKRVGVAAAGGGARSLGDEEGGTLVRIVAVAEPETREGRIRGCGLERLRRAADRRLARASDTLADVLFEKATEGKLDGARMLVTLAEQEWRRKEEEKKNKTKVRKGPSWAELLASEPEWEEEKPEVGDVWVGDGWRKQETGDIVRQ